ncbi:MAG: hypothetical protein HPY50_08060 [Firmicutes bacterium]|nr:hypothetical protein [Bacillota bacterium]
MAKDKDPWGSKAFGQALSMATSMAAALLLGYLLGSYLDKLLGTSPWLLVTLLLLGMGTGLKMMYETAFGRIGKERDINEEQEGESEKFKLKDSIDSLKDAQRKLKEDRQRLLREKWVEEYREQKEKDENPRS